MNPGLTAGIKCAMKPLTYVCKCKFFVTYVTVMVCCIHMTHIKFATLSKLFQYGMKDKYRIACQRQLWRYLFFRLVFSDLYLGEKRERGVIFLS